MLVDTRQMIPSRAVRKHSTALPFLAILAGACGGQGKSVGDGGGADEIARAQALDVESAILPARPDVIALGQSIESLALKEGAGARAVELHALAAHLHERIWRVEHREQDAKEAVDLYRSAGRDGSPERLPFEGARDRTPLELWRGG